MDKNEWISNKIKKLMSEGKGQNQAIAQAYAMYEDGGNPPSYTWGYTGGNRYMKDFNNWLRGNSEQENFKPFNTGQQNTWLPGNIPSNPEFGNVNFTAQKPKTEIVTNTSNTAQEQTLQPEVKSVKSVLGDNFKPSTQDNEAILQRMAEEQKQLSVDLKDQETPDSSFTQQDPIQFFNPYGGVDLNSAASIFGQSLQSGDALSGIASGTKLFAGLGRNFMGGFAAGKAREEAIADYEKNRRNAMTGVKNPTAMGQDGGTFYAQEGGEMQQQDPMLEQILMMLQQGATPEQVLQQLISSGIPQEQAIQAIQMVMQSAQQEAQAMPQEEMMMQEGGMFNQPEVPEQMANAEIEGGEYVRDGQGIKYAEGEKHSNGGIPTQLENGAQVLSDFKKVGKELAKQLSEQLGVKIRPTDTFASVLDKYDIKSGYKETQEEVESMAKKIAEQEKKVKNDATLALNKQVLSEEIEEEMQELSKMEGTRQQVFDLLFQSQEATKAQETQEGNFMRDGGTIKDLMTKYNISEEDAKTLIPNYQKGGVPERFQNLTDAATLGQLQGNARKYTNEEKQAIKKYYETVVKDKNSLKVLNDRLDNDTLVYNANLLTEVMTNKDIPLQYQSETEKNLYGVQTDSRLKDYLYASDFQQKFGRPYGTSPNDEELIYDEIVSSLEKEGVKYQGSPVTNRGTKLFGNVNAGKPKFVKEMTANQEYSLDAGAYKKATEEQKEALARTLGVDRNTLDQEANKITTGFIQFKPATQPSTPTEVTPTAEVPLTPEQAIVAEEEKKKGRLNMMLLPDQTPMQPWGMLPPAMTTQTIYAPKYNEIDPQEQLMEIQRNKLNTLVGIQNLPDSQQAASALALDANTNMATNKVMTETDRYNAMARERTEGAEAMQKTQQSQANIVGLQQYQQLLGQELEANEADWRAFYNRLNTNNFNNWNSIERANQYNAFSGNVQNTGNGYVLQNVIPKTQDASAMNINFNDQKNKKKK